MSEFLLGIDAGTTVIKAALFDLHGKQVGSHSAQVALQTPRTRWVERDMHELWNATVRAVRGCLANADIAARRIAAIGITGHGDGLYAVDNRLQPVRAAVVALDTRAHRIIDEWQNSPLWSEILQVTGQVPFAGSFTALLAWFQRHDPETLHRSKWLLFCKDWIKLQLTGEISTDVTDASAGFTDLRTREYSQQALNRYGLDGLRDRLPEILPSEAIAGTVTSAAAAETGLTAGTRVVAGTHDVDAAAIGMGAIRPGTLSVICGSFSINQLVSDHVQLDPRWAARCFVRPGQRMNISASPTSTINLEWFLDAFGLRTGGTAEVLDAVDREVRQRLTSPSQVLYLPYLYGAPYGEEGAGAFFGLRAWHDRADLLRAILEGVVLNHRRHVDALRSGFSMDYAARLSGGAARSDLWAQMFADGLGLEIELPDSEETGARGAALLAGIGIGAHSDLDEAASLAGVARRYTPHPARAAMLADTYRLFLDTAERLEPLWKRFE
jgi:L-xylulokinase